jgi:hypothetical protein
MRRLAPTVLLVLLALTLTTSLAGAAAAAATPQLVVISAHADRLAGTLIVTGLDFGEEEAPRVTLGVDDLEVIEYSQGRIEAELPASFPAGSYILIVARGPGLNEYDVFNAAVPEVPVRSLAPATPLGGPRGPMGPPGPVGPAGASGRSELAGLRCPAGSYLAGFDPAGELVCEALPSVPADAPPAQQASALTAATGTPAAAPRAALDCGGDAAGDGADLPGAWSPRVPVLAEYPATHAGVLRGRLGGADDADLLALAASETRGRFCLSDDRDRALTARLGLTSDTAGASLCACWSRLGEPCALSRNRCAPVPAGGTAELTVPMKMLCGAVDSGFLEVEVRPASTTTCSDWQLNWEIAE